MGPFANSEDLDGIHRMKHFISVCTVCFNKTYPQGLKYLLIWKLLFVQPFFKLTLFITETFFTKSVVFAQRCQFRLNLNSLQQKFSLTSSYLGTNTMIIVKRVGFTMHH